LGLVGDGDDELSKLFWGKTWSATDIDADVCLADFLAQTDDNAVLDLKAEDILQQDIFV
jgi:hypothetical protein